MNSIYRKWISVILTLIIFLNLISIININYNDNNFIQNQKPANDNIYNPLLTRGKFPDRIINRNRIVNYTADLILGNLTILDDATLNVEGCDLEIQGKLTVKDNGRLFVKNSNITIAPGPVDIHEIIINFSNNAKIRFEGSNIYTDAQPSLTNISYLLSDDDSEVTIINCYMNCKLPSILHLDIELTPPTAGTFILTGDTVWNIYDTKIEGFLKITDDGKLESRWFLFTLQRNANLYMKNSYGFMNDASQPFIKPVSGYVKIEDSVIPNGVIDVEVVGELEAINLTIEDLNFRDQTKSKLKNCYIENSLDAGSVAIIPSVTGSKMVIDPTQQKPKTQLIVEDTSIGQTLVAQGNSTITLKNSDVSILTISADSTIYMENCDIKNLVEIKNKTTLNLINTTVNNIIMGGQSTLNIQQSTDSFPISILTTRFNCQGTISLHSTIIKTVEIFGGDLVQPPYGPGYDPDENISRLSFDMVDSTINRLKTEDDSELYFKIENSNINDFSFKRVKNESIKITILDLGGTYNIPIKWPDIDLVFYINHQIVVTSQVNGIPVKSKVQIKNQQGDLIRSTYTNDHGIKYFELLYEVINGNKTGYAGIYNITLNYLGLSKAITSEAEINDEYNVKWFDQTPPVISNIEIDTEYHRSKRPTRIRATIIDSDIRVIANASIFYQYTKDGSWTNWKKTETDMLEVENNTFEGEIKIEDLPDGTEIRFYIISYDILGNNISTPKQSYKVENPDIFFIYLVLIIFIVLIVLLVTSIVKRRAKLNKYAKKTSNKEMRIIYENHK
jgi:hypothetical protein